MNSHSPDVRTFPAPKTRDPIVNTVLVGLGVKNRLESYWISTYNRNLGAIGLRLDEWGECRTYMFPWQHEGFYSAVHVGRGIMWLCGRLDRVVRLDLHSGAWESYDTGVPKARVFEGMIYDAATQKIFALSQPFHSSREISPSVGVSFDIRRRQTACLHEIEIAESCSRVSFANGDGSYTMGVQIPGESLVRWNPHNETVTARTLSTTPVLNQEGHEKLTCRLIGDEAGRWYWPGYGWYDPRTEQFSDAGPRPEREMTWFAKRDNLILGAQVEGSDLSVHGWNPDNGKVEYLLKIPDCDVFNLNTTQSGSLLAVNAFGVFYRFNLESGALEASRLLPTENHGDSLTVCRIGDDLFGCPYVSSRFWRLNLQSGEGTDCGRGHTAWGQISLMERVGDKAYFAAYGSGELLEFDPARTLCYPENPRCVADPPDGMRPTASTNDGRYLFYACSADYGRLGCALTRYDTVTGRATYVHNPLGDQQIVSLVFDASNNELICGTTFHGDSMSVQPTSNRCLVARLDAKTLRVKQKTSAPAGWTMARVQGPLDVSRWLVTGHDHISGPPTCWMSLERDGFQSFARSTPNGFPAGWHGGCGYAGRPGQFILNIEDRLELWDMIRQCALATLFQPFDPRHIDGYLWSLQDDALVILRAREVLLVENCLPLLP